jgi:peptidoglycan-associated lipoprotein
MRAQVILVAVVTSMMIGAAVAQSDHSPAQYLPAATDTDGSSASVSPPTMHNDAQQQEVQQNIRDVHFAFDRYDLRPEDRQALEVNARWLKQHPEMLVTIEGDADERGDIVYNVVLSDERAAVTKDALVQLGVPAGQIIFATGWGKLYPVCSESDESCWAQNRRAHFAPW